MARENKPAVSKHRDIYCYGCKHGTKHAATAAYVSGVGIRPAYVCCECGTLIPEESLDEYMRSGNIVIKQDRRNRK